MSSAPFRDREVRSGRSSHREAPERERDRSQHDCLTVCVTNLPNDYTWRELKSLFGDRVGEVIYALVGKDGSGIVEFMSGRTADTAALTMNGHKVNGRPIYVKKDITGEYRKKIKMELNKVDKMEYSVSESERNYYGLNKQFVESLNISVPLVNRAFVMNLDFRADAAKLKEVFSMAGQVQHVDLYKNLEGASKGMAVIQFDHPVEVVQAISMFNMQMLYERPMVVRMDRSPNREFALPEGLGGVGPGLGPEGAPLRNVALSIYKQEGEKSKKINYSTDNFPKDPPGDFNDSNIDPLNLLESPRDHPDNRMNYPDNQMNYPNNQMKRPENQMNRPGNQMNHPGNQMNSPMWSSNSNSASVNQPMRIPNVQIVPVAVPMNNMNMNVSPNQMKFPPPSMNVMPPVNSQVGSQVLTRPNNSNVGGGGGDNNLSGGINAQTLMALLNLQSQIQQQGLSVSDVPKILSLIETHVGPDKGNSSKTEGAKNAKPGSLPQNVEGTSYKNSDVADRRKAFQSDMVTVTNLPSTVTPQMVHENFGAAGNVKFVDMTSPGSALVRFTSNWEAEKAIKIFDRTRVNGEIIDVAYF